MVSTRGTGPLEQQLLRGGRQLLFTQVESVQIEEVVVVRGRGWSTVQAINVLALQKKYTQSDIRQFLISGRNLAVKSFLAFLTRILNFQD